MRQLKLRRWAALACWGVSWASLPSAAIGGQGNGDYDGDYDVDASDFLNWVGCMTGFEEGGVTQWEPCRGPGPVSASACIMNNEPCSSS